MPYGLSYDSPGALPGIILLISLMLTLLKHAMILCQKRFQQENVAVSQKPPCGMHTCEGSKGTNHIFRSDRRTHEKRFTKTEHCGRTGGTPPIATKDPIVKTSKRMGKVYLTTTSKVDQKCLNRPTLQTIMSKYQQDPHTMEL